MKYIDYDEWKYNKAFRHYNHKLVHSFGTNEITDDMRQSFNHNYIIKYPKCSKILKLNGTI